MKKVLLIVAFVATSVSLMHASEDASMKDRLIASIKSKSYLLSTLSQLAVTVGGPFLLSYFPCCSEYLALVPGAKSYPRAMTHGLGVAVTLGVGQVCCGADLKNQAAGVVTGSGLSLVKGMIPSPF